MLTVAAGAVLIGFFGPWLRSGTSTRSSFELLDLVERLGFSSGGLFDWAVRGWPLVPLLVVSAVVACWAGRTTATVCLGLASGVYVAGVAIGVRNAPDAGLVATGWAVDVSLAAGLGLLGVAVWIAVTAATTRTATTATRRCSGLPEPALGEDGAE